MRRAIVLAPYGLALAVAYATKRFYAGASASDLEPALGPTTWLITRLTGARFTFEEGVGYVSPELKIAVVPGCAGLNFMIVVFLALVFGFTDRWSKTSHRALFMVASAAVAYGSTLVVNAARIVGSSRVFTALEVPLALGFDEVHRAVGVAIYVTTLFALVAVVERLFALRRVPT
jgi:exosortase K